MKNLLFILLFLVFSLSCLYYFTGYRSAFEADQECHYQIWKEYSGKDGFGCDHDIETNQWILFQRGIDHEPAKVLKRFHY